MKPSPARGGGLGGGKPSEGEKMMRAHGVLRATFAFATPNFAPIPAFPRKRGKGQINDVSVASLDQGKPAPRINAD